MTLEANFMHKGITYNNVVFVLQSTTASPTPQSVFHEAPRTNILPRGDDAEDRLALLPELARAMAAANEILQQQVEASSGFTASRSNLPWTTPTTSAIVDHPDDLVPPREGEETSNIIRPFDDAERDNEDDGSSDLAIDLDDVLGITTSTPPTPIPTQYNQRELLNLATLLDRLGRTLMDAAPHIASLAANLPSEDTTPSQDDDLFDEAVEHALDEIADSMPRDSNTNPTETSIGGLLSLWSQERRRRAQSNTNASTGETNNISTSGRATIDPDHEDYVSGLVNTTRGEVRTGPRSRVAGDDVANLLGAYLAAATLGSATASGDGDGDEGSTNGVTGSLGLGQLLRAGTIGGSGGGIDIHIHAVVTSPGMTPGGVGIATLGGAGGALAGTGPGGTRNLFSSTQRRNTATTSILRTSRPFSSSLLSSRRRIHVSDEEDDTGIFAELYSETPEPIDPNGSPAPRDTSSSPVDVTIPLVGTDIRSNDAMDYITGLRTSYTGNSSFGRERETPADFLARVNNQSAPMDHANVGAASVAGRGVSSTRRRASRQSFRRESADDASDTTPSRRTGWGRLFRRRSSRDEY